MACHELAGAVAPGVLAREPRHAGQMQIELERELFDRAVTPVRLLARRHHRYVVEVAAQLPAQTLRRAGALRSDALQLRARDASRLQGIARRRRLLLADHAFDFVKAQPRNLEWTLAAEQLVEQHTEHVDIARGGDQLATNLLRARMVRGHDAHVCLRHRDRVRGGTHVEELRDTEVEQLRCAVSGDQDVARLEIAMDDEVTVRGLYGRAHHAKQPQACGDAQSMLVAVGVDGLAFDILQYQVRNAVDGGAAVEQACDVRVIQRGQNLPLGAQARLYLPRQHAATDELDGDLLLVLLIGALAQVDLAHPALAQHAQHLVGANAI